MGLTEANQILTLNNLRHNVTLRTDGGLKTGRDIVMAAIVPIPVDATNLTPTLAPGLICFKS